MLKCEFCGNRLGHVEIEVLNISEGETLTCHVCIPCAVLTSGTSIRYDSEGIPYSDLGCIGGTVEDTH
jgi:protein-arginine kinase activator protein McsA